MRQRFIIIIVLSIIIDNDYLIQHNAANGINITITMIIIIVRVPKSSTVQFRPAGRVSSRIPAVRTVHNDL